MDLGFEAVGFKHSAAIEFSEVFCRTLRTNRPEWRVFGPPFHRGDVSDFDDVASTLSPLITSPFEGVFVGGAALPAFLNRRESEILQVRAEVQANWV